MIQNAKQSLRMRNVKLDYDELHTILVEVEGTLNSRPLTFVSSDDVEEPLTLYHLFYGRRILSLPDFSRNREASLNQAVSSGDLPRRRKYMQLLLEHFWKRWSREYVTELGTCTVISPGQKEVFQYLLEMLLSCSKITYLVVSGDLEEWNS